MATLTQSRTFPHLFKEVQETTATATRDQTREQSGINKKNKPDYSYLANI